MTDEGQRGWGRWARVASTTSVTFPGGEAVAFIAEGDGPGGACGRTSDTANTRCGKRGSRPTSSRVPMPSGTHLDIFVAPLQGVLGGWLTMMPARRPDDSAGLKTVGDAWGPQRVLAGGLQ